ncbi:ROK family transcriptional regulator [Kribbella sp. CA-293567]|uniref:ROK family transcriptional regulator n=1 Tax=Kribbella sp. CA-293567 TaxID=3002436 RepID=UPI0022DE5D41|nr:ROK family transcriptional regulator [Kribbella sp. CA-293567]WBQ08242.1 ROK family transcriptional regulator [Kribbella sp. CA-293567]
MAFPQVPSPRRELPGRRKARTQDNRVHNRSLVLATLYHHGPMTRPELTRASGLTAPTVSALVGDLADDGLVAETGPRDGPRPGKPAKLVRLDDGNVNLVVLDLSHSDRFTGAVLDLRGGVVHRAEVALDGALGREAFDLVFRLADELVAAAPRRVLGIGVGTPGIVDDTGTVRQAAHLRWIGLPLAEQLGDRYAVPAYVGNDINLAALGVLRFRPSEARNLMVLSIEHGVGAGLVVGGELVEGEQFAAGELGHVTVDDDGDPCVCGRRGCLDQHIAAAFLRRRLGAGADRPAVLAAAGRTLGIVLAPIISALNLDEVVLTGPPELIDGAFLQAATVTARARTLSPISSSVRVTSLAGDDDLILLGAAGLVLSAQLGIW